MGLAVILDFFKTIVELVAGLVFYQFVRIDIDRYLALWPLLRPRFSPDSAKSENRMVISVQSDVFIMKISVFVMK